MNPSPETSYLLRLSATDVDLNHLRQHHPIPEKKITKQKIENIFTNTGKIIIIHLQPFKCSEMMCTYKSPFTLTRTVPLLFFFVSLFDFIIFRFWIGSPIALSISPLPQTVIVLIIQICILPTPRSLVFIFNCPAFSPSFI